jgi:hypothetical protein
MSKLFHMILGITWFYIAMTVLEVLESGDFGLLHIAAMFILGGIAATQIVHLVQEIIAGE